MSLVEHGVERNLALLALGWVGNRVAQTAFSRWQSESPPWSSKMQVSFSNYTLEAGWELSPDGLRQQLYSEIAYPLTTLSNANDLMSDRVRTCIEREATWRKRTSAPYGVVGFGYVASGRSSRLRRRRRRSRSRRADCWRRSSTR